MNFFIFFIYFFFSLLISVLIGLFIYKLFVRRKCSILSKIASTEIDNYFNAYDNNNNSSSNEVDFVDTIHIIDKEKESQKRQLF